MAISPRTLLRFALYLVAGLVVCLLLLIVFLQTAAGGRWLAGVVASQAERFVDGEVAIGRISGSLLRGATVEQVALSRAGQTLLAVERLSADYDLIGLLFGGDLALDDIELVRPEIYLTRGPDGLAIAALFGGGGEPTQEPEGPARRLSVSPIVIEDGYVLIGPEPAEAGGFRVPDEIRQLNARLSVERGVDDLDIRIDQLSFVGVAPAFTLSSLSGEIRYTGADLVFDGVEVKMPDSEFSLNGAIENVAALGD